MSSLADYNNNPGNLKPPKGVTYEGQIGVDENGFAVFENKEYGKNALLNDIEYKVKTHKLNNPEDFIDRYSPAGEENSEDSRDNYKIGLANALGLSSTKDPFPEDSYSKIADVISQFESGQSRGVSEEPVSKEAVPESAVIPTQESSRKEGTELYPYGYLGAAAGTGLAGAVETGRQVLPLLENIKNSVTERSFNPTAPRTRSGLTNYMRSQLPPELQDMTLRQMEQATQQATGRPKIRTMSEVQDALAEVKGASASTVQKPKVKWIAPNLYENTNQFRVTQTPAKPAIDLTEYETKQGIRAALRRQGAKAAEGATRFLPSISRVGLGGVGGALAIPAAYNAFEDVKKEGWTPRTTAESLAALGGGLMAIPTPFTEIGGALLQVPQLGMDIGQSESFKRGLEGTYPQTKEEVLQNPYSVPIQY